VRGNGLDPEARLQIYRRHVFTTLTAALTATFPVVCRLVDARFFAYAADAYIRQHPPTGPCLTEYGATFPAFLAGFPPCRGHAYLPDVARLEWAMNLALHADAPAGLDTAALARVPPEMLSRLVFRLDPSVSLIASPWPIDRIWQANQENAAGVVDLQSGGVHLEVRRIDGRVAMGAVSPPRHTFRQALAAGGTLEDAASAALRLDSRFDLTREIRQFIEDRLPDGFTFSPGDGSRDP
jgi:hypothetical protein